MSKKAKPAKSKSKSVSKAHDRELMLTMARVLFEHLASHGGDLKADSAGAQALQEALEPYPPPH